MSRATRAPDGGVRTVGARRTSIAITRSRRGTGPDSPRAPGAHTRGRPARGDRGGGGGGRAGGGGGRGWAAAEAGGRIPGGGEPPPEAGGGPPRGRGRSGESRC